MRLRRLAICGLVLLAAALAPGAQAAAAFTLGFDPIPTSPFWLHRAVSEGAGIVRISGGWPEVAPAQRPPGFIASDPASPGYSWSSVDGQVRALTSQGLQVLLVFTGAPTWAEGPGRPKNTPPGSWKPDPKQFGEFARAAALRYDGSFPDPLHPGAVLPRVRYWQAWNEPNLDNYLTPQWTHKRGSGFSAASPGIYRQLLNAFYTAVKGVSRSNIVVTAGISPYGNSPTIIFPLLGHRMPPLDFDRALFSAPVHFDVLAQSIYPISGPLWHAYGSDIATPDMYKLRNAMAAGERAGHVLPRGPKRLWVTEFAWNSAPPFSRGVPIFEQARWYEQAMYVLWRQGVDTMLFLNLVDGAPGPFADFFRASGLYYVNGRPKPAATAFRFPFVTSRINASQIQTWGRAPVSGQALIELLRGHHWDVIARLPVQHARVFVRTLPLRGRGVLRAQIGGQTSLPWTQF